MDTILKNSVECLSFRNPPVPSIFAPRSTMKFTSIATIVALAFPTVTFATTVSYDQIYDEGSTSLSQVVCSDGPNGLETKKFTTFDSLPKFPYIGGAQSIAGWNSPNCGTCWKLTYTNSKKVKKSINVLAIDHTDAGFNIALEAMDELTGGLGKELGRINVTSTKVAASDCGL